MQIHLVGNGKSNHLFDQQYGFCIMCNIPKSTHPADVISIIDQKVVSYQKSNQYQFKPTQKIWCTDAIMRFAKKNHLQGDWLPVYTNKHRWNSGHLAVQHALQQSPHCKIFNLWGMDSMFSDDLTSEMDDRVIRPTRPPLNREWRPNWCEIFAQYPSTRFMIHATHNHSEYNYGHNVKIEIH